MNPSEMLANVGKLPPISTAGLKLTALLNRPDTDNEDVVRVLKQDAVLTAKLLRVANSPALGLRDRIASVDQAVLFLGHEQIFQMTSALTFGSAMGGPLRAYFLGAGDLWRHSLLAANAAEVASGEGLGFDVESSVAFTIGLLHDIGKLIINEFLVQHGIALGPAESLAGPTGLEAERRALGTDHAEVGGALARLWRLPETIVEAITFHHQPVLEPQPHPSALANFADALAHRTVAALRGQQLTMGTEIFTALGYTGAHVRSLLERVGEAGTATSFRTLLA